jgi:hypothetical protein
MGQANLKLVPILCGNDPLHGAGQHRGGGIQPLLYITLLKNVYLDHNSGIVHHPYPAIGCMLVHLPGFAHLLPGVAQYLLEL